MLIEVLLASLAHGNEVSAPQALITGADGGEQPGSHLATHADLPQFITRSRRHPRLRRPAARDRGLNEFVLIQSALLRARLVRNHTLARLAPSPDELLRYRRAPRKGMPTARRQPRRRRTATGMRADRSRPPERSEPCPVFGFHPPALDMINLGQRDESSPKYSGDLQELIRLF
jgi:hypothetical protein